MNKRKPMVKAKGPLQGTVKSGRIILTPRTKSRRKGKIVTDTLTGLPVFSLGPDAPVLTSKEVAKILSNFQ